MKFPIFHKQKGLTLIELIAGLAIVAAVLVGALALFQGANTSQKSVQLSSDLNSIRTAVRSLYSGTGRYVNDTNGNMDFVLYKSRKLPSNVQVTAGATTATLNHAFNNTMTVSAGASPTWFLITLNGIPADACMNLLTGSGAWPRILVNAAPSALGPVQAVGTGATSPAIGPTSAVHATTACTDPENNTIYFVSN